MTSKTPFGAKGDLWSSRECANPLPSHSHFPLLPVFEAFFCPPFFKNHHILPLLPVSGANLCPQSFQITTTFPSSLVFLETQSDFLSSKTWASFFHYNHSLSPLPGSRENFCPLISQNITTFPLFRVLKRILFNEYAFFHSCWFFRLDFWWIFSFLPKE